MTTYEVACELLDRSALHPVTKQSIHVQPWDGQGWRCGCRVTSGRSLWLCEFHGGFVPVAVAAGEARANYVKTGLLLLVFWGVDRCEPQVGRSRSSPTSRS